MKVIVLYASIAVASGVMFVNMYNSIVDVQSWGANIPQSIETARTYYQTVNPASFFRVFSPVNQMLALMAVILLWKPFPQARLFLFIALALYVAGDVFTFTYFYPRNDIMLKTSPADVERLKTVWMQWRSMNWLRSLVVFIGLVFSFLSLHKISA